MKELIQSLLESSKERVKNPITGAFIISWLTINWRIVLILLFSDKIIEDKIDYIQCYYFDLTFNLWLPLAFALLYPLLLPYLMAVFDGLLKWAIVNRKLFSKEQRLRDIQYQQEIAAEEWQLEKIRQGSQDISQLKDRVAEAEQLIREKDDLIVSISKKVTDEKQAPKVTEIKEQETISSETSGSSKEQRDFTTMKDIVIRDLPKTEREWILIYTLYASEFGTRPITRDEILLKYEESNRRTDSRLGNLTNNIKTMIKTGQLKFINDDQMLLTSMGIEMAKDILNR